MATNPYENPYNQQNQNPYQSQTPQQPSWGGTVNQGPQQASTYNQYAGQPQQSQQPQAPRPGTPQASPNWGWPQQQQQQPMYGQAQPGSAPQGSYPQQYNYTQQQPQYSQAPTSWQQPQQGQPGGWPTAPQQDTSKWNTDKYAKPQYVAQNFAGHAPPGWSRDKWNDPSHQTPKYVIGRILSGYKPSRENAARAAQDIARAYPGSTFNGKDRITVPGVGSFDILKNAGSGKNMAWRPGTTQAARETKGGGGAVAAAQPAQAQAAADPYTALLQSLVAPQAAQAPAAQSWESSPQYQAMSEQMAALQQQMATWQQQATAQQNQQRNAGPQFSYY